MKFEDSICSGCENYMEWEEYGCAMQDCKEGLLRCDELFRKGGCRGFVGVPKEVPPYGEDGDL